MKKCTNLVEDAYSLWGSCVWEHLVEGAVPLFPAKSSQDKIIFSQFSGNIRIRMFITFWHFQITIHSANFPNETPSSHEHISFTISHFLFSAICPLDFWISSIKIMVYMSVRLGEERLMKSLLYPNWIPCLKFTNFRRSNSNWNSPFIT